MPAERFFLDAPFEGIVTLEGNELHHLAHVMRVRVGEEVELVDGKGSMAQGKVAALTKQKATIEILTVEKKPKSPLRYILAVPLMRPSKMELVVEKCTELGADAFWLYSAAHSEKEDLSANQLERLHTIAVAAMKQCGRLDLPQIHKVENFEDLFREKRDHEKQDYFFGDTRADALKLTPQEKGVFITGPERGFSEKELKILDQYAKGVSLHSNILRAETAPLVALLRAQL